eukprot:CAMPEP_0113850152 /NCGR_PEP_ID=MMETSP0372-20130328/3656_1 /TAXON_ID=340204 /ORGANISM="Lankesteria abbotti" /LENGTH=185 /DNA_ID=CAMNT_0000820279 /DNA_START=237 /DNA_END=794 /DNA_ORIENTATION=- /assembly_acc=CAM_ASM_000359
MGGKWTTYRRMAQDAVDKVLEVHGKKFGKTQKPRTKFMLMADAIDSSKQHKTEEINSVGGRLPAKLMHDFGISIDTARHLVSNYGFRAIELCKTGYEMGTLTPLVEGHPFQRAEILYGIRHEMARTPLDVLARRMRVAFVDVDAATSVLSDVVGTMATELKWSPSTAAKMKKDSLEFFASMKGGN